MSILTMLASKAVDSLLGSDSKDSHPAAVKYNTEWNKQMAQSLEETKALTVANTLKSRASGAKQLGMSESRNVAPYRQQQASQRGLQIIRNVSQKAVSDPVFAQLIQKQGDRMGVPNTVATTLALNTDSAMTEAEAGIRQTRTSGFISQPTLGA